jgi:hypothetical protein
MPLRQKLRFLLSIPLFKKQLAPVWAIDTTETGSRRRQLVWSYYFKGKRRARWPTMHGEELILSEDGSVFDSSGTWNIFKWEPLEELE